MSSFSPARLRFVSRLPIEHYFGYDMPLPIRPKKRRRVPSPEKVYSAVTSPPRSSPPTKKVYSITSSPRSSPQSPRSPKQTTTTSPRSPKQTTTTSPRSPKQFATSPLKKKAITTTPKKSILIRPGAKVKGLTVTIVSPPKEEVRAVREALRGFRSTESAKQASSQRRKIKRQKQQIILEEEQQYQPLTPSWQETLAPWDAEWIANIQPMATAVVTLQRPEEIQDIIEAQDLGFPLSREDTRKLYEWLNWEQSQMNMATTMMTPQQQIQYHSPRNTVHKVIELDED
jgi:hypothetical protein